MGNPVEYTFIVKDRTSVELVLADDLPLLQEALRDCISTHPPQGAAQDGPSTYWIDRALTYLRCRLEDGGKEELASGNATYLQVRNGMAEARYDFALEDDEFDAVPGEELLELLTAWRATVLQQSATADKRVPPPPKAYAMPPL
jgi:hypothetical protein